MGPRNFGNQEENFIFSKPPEKSLLSAGWRPLHRQIDWGYMWELASNNPWEITQKTVDVTSEIADALGRKDYAWWANIINVFSNYTRNEIDEFWDYITPKPPEPDYNNNDMLSTLTPVMQFVSRDSIPIDYVLSRLLEITILKVLDLLGKPDMITQTYQGRSFYYPIEKFVNWQRIESMGMVLAYWSQYETWLKIENSGRKQRQYTIIAPELGPLVNKATYGLAVMLSGYQSRVGQIQSQFPIRMFPADIQSFTDAVQQAVFDQHQLAVLVHGEPGTGKTAWTQAVAKEILVPLGYVIFILDHDAVEHFVPPSYLERICLIINEADNLAQDRSSAAAQRNSKTEHILSLLDGTLYQSVIEEGGIRAYPKLAVLMTCNTTERLDRAVLRKGRIDLIYEFTHRFV